MFGKIWSFFRSIGRVAESVKQSEELFVTEELYEYRRQVCEGCPHYKDTFDMCGECYCVIHVKAKLHTEHCPLNKW